MANDGGPGLRGATAELPDTGHPPRSRFHRRDLITLWFLQLFLISALDAHQFCLMQRKAILISNRSKNVLS
jgi:hypothetical protein